MKTLIRHCCRTGWILLLPPLLSASDVVTVRSLWGGSEAGPWPCLFELERTGDLSMPLSVGFDLGGTAEPAELQVLDPLARFAAGAATCQVAILPLNDTEEEAAETVTLSLRAGERYVAGTPSVAEASVEDAFLSGWPGLFGEDGNELGYFELETHATTLRLRFLLWDVTTIGTPFEIPLATLGNPASVDGFVKTPKGGRLPRLGSLNGSTRTCGVRAPRATRSVTAADALGDAVGSGLDLSAVTFHILGDRFFLEMDYASTWNPDDFFAAAPKGQIWIDSDHSLTTGGYCMGRQIPTWGGDLYFHFELGMTDLFSIYTDPGGAASANTDLIEVKAQVVRDCLVVQGILSGLYQSLEGMSWISPRELSPSPFIAAIPLATLGDPSGAVEVMVASNQFVGTPAYLDFAPHEPLRVSVPLSGGTAFERWLAERFADAPAEALPGADPDGDGLVNSLEFFLGSDPRDAASAVLPELRFPADLPGWAVFTWPAAGMDTSGVRGEVQCSQTLDAGSWTAAGVTDLGPKDGWLRYGMELTEGNNAGFFRLEVTVEPTEQ